MTKAKQSKKLHLQELIAAAKEKAIEVRTEKLLREIGYRVRSGRCRVMGKDVILLDREAPVGDQVEVLASVLAEEISKRN